MTSIAALQAVEQGLFTLDQDISPLIPEISKNGVLQGFTEEGKAIVEERKNPITLRQLITHASGATYPTFHPWTLKHQTQRGIDPLGQNNAATVTERHDAAMVFQPGEGWMYSPGLDWYGLLLQRKTKGQYDLESWMREFLWKPLGISQAEITFWPDEAMKRKIPPLMVRNSEGKLCPNTADTINTLSTECFGGHGAYAELSAYTKILRSLLADDGTLLRKTTVREMFRPQLGDASRAALNGFMQRTVALLPGDLDPEIPVTYGLGGMLFEAGEVDRRLKGTMNWSGLFNCFWILDREAGIA
ncbi:Hypothetical predicted protein [Lecanosticta acicola]|uniref:Beta-lactamase-related domain-containing protein n=1 Tax=Lecanosticta acicola TaxID=111012 RepID=A0AAI9EBI2_9PEZI|nr:Hypothetical predicted protein [Lecanosticta acicola]